MKKSWLLLLLCILTVCQITSAQLINGWEGAPRLTCKENNIIYLDKTGTKKLEASMFVDDCIGCTVDIVGDLYQDTADCNLAGKDIIVHILQPTTGRSVFCSGYIADIFKPEFVSCPRNVTINCWLDLYSYPIDSFGIQVSDSCGIDSIYPLVCGTTRGDCIATLDTIKVLWQAFDLHGNMDTCTQFIATKKPFLSDVNVRDDTLLCEQFTFDSLPEPLLYDSIPLKDNCGLLAKEMNRIVIPGCGASKDIIRIWSILDICSLVSKLDTQYICVIDTTGPTINMWHDTLYTLDTFCQVLYELEFLDSSRISNNCAEDETAFLMYKYRNEFWRPGLFLALDTGIHELTVIAADDCWNYDSITSFVTVLDTIGPILDSCPTNNLQFIYYSGLDTVTQCASLNDSAGGPALFISHCCTIDSIFCILVNEIDPNIDTGFITRTYWAIDSCGNFSDTCVQRIVIDDVSRRSQMIKQMSGLPTQSIKGRDTPAVSISTGNRPDPFTFESRITPNPFSDEITLQVNVSVAERVLIEVFDQTGRKWYQTSKTVDPGLNEVRLDDQLLNIPNGMFWLRITGAHYGINTHKILHMR